MSDDQTPDSIWKRLARWRQNAWDRLTDPKNAAASVILSFLGKVIVSIAVALGFIWSMLAPWNASITLSPSATIESSDYTSLNDHERSEAIASAVEHGGYDLAIQLVGGFPPGAARDEECNHIYKNALQNDRHADAKKVAKACSRATATAAR